MPGIWACTPLPGLASCSHRNQYCSAKFFNWQASEGTAAAAPPAVAERLPRCRSLLLLLLARAAC